jgi:hypothetical protein
MQQWDLWLFAGRAGWPCAAILYFCHSEEKYEAKRLAGLGPGDVVDGRRVGAGPERQEG